MTSDRINNTSPAQSHSHESLFADFYKSVFQSAVEHPVTAVGQLFDKNFDWNPVNPETVKTGSAAYYAEGIGGAVGMAADLLPMKFGLGKLGETELASNLGVASTLKNSIALSATTGALYGGLFTPTANGEGLLSGRLKNAALDAGTFAALDGLSQKFAAKPSSNFLLNAADRIGTSAAIGIPIGMLNTQASSLLHDGHFAGKDQTLQAGIDWAVIGGAMAVPDALSVKPTIAAEPRTETLQLANYTTERVATDSAQTPKETIETSAQNSEWSKEQIKSLYPQETAEKVMQIANDGGTPLSDILMSLRSVRSGQRLYDLLEDKANAGTPLTPSSLDALVKEARDTDKQPSRFKMEFPRNLSFNDPDYILHSTANTIAGMLRGQTIVLLGRDAWPLVPMLRGKGVDAQYFSWSRLQKDEPGTNEQWLKEVPPKTAVIDTGFRGSIFDEIKKIDKTFRGYLISTWDRNVYPQLSESKTSAFVEMIEQTPKLVGRSTAYKNGFPVYLDSKDSQDQAGPNGNQVQIEKDNEAYLQRLGVSPWAVWRYKSFIGMTPESRIGLDTPEEVQAHYDKVKAARAKS